MSHVPVLLHACLEGLNIKKDGVYVDVTYGGGGHSKAILDELDENGKLIAFDTDEDAKERALNDDRFTLINENFRHVSRFLKLHGIAKVDGVLADFGISSFQLDSESRGFSNRFNAPLDMRMNKLKGGTAAELINSAAERELQLLFQQYGEIRNAKTLASAIYHAAHNRKLKTTGDLIEAVEPVIKGNRNRYLAQVFQSLRIEVNQELDAIKEYLEQMPAVIKPGGRLVVMSFHSLEDRMVKNFIRSGKVSGEPDRDEFGRYETPFKPINKKVIVASEEEIKENKRARSAKLRIAERKSGTE